jgi:Family of unknown function (DUF6364)
VYTYHVGMNITLSVADEIVERAREVAHQQGTSLNALVRSYLESLAGRAGGQELADRFDALWNERAGHSGGWRFDREELYEERLNRGRQ